MLINFKNNQQTILFMIDLFNNKMSYNFRDIYILNNQLHSYATRQGNNIHKQFRQNKLRLLFNTHV